MNITDILYLSIKVSRHKSALSGEGFVRCQALHVGILQECGKVVRQVRKGCIHRHLNMHISLQDSILPIYNIFIMLAMLRKTRLKLISFTKKIDFHSIYKLVDWLWKPLVFYFIFRKKNIISWYKIVRWFNRTH